MEQEEWKMKSINLTASDIRVYAHIIVKDMKNGKSPGPWDINLELVKYGGRKVLTPVTKLLNKILQGDNIPQEMKTGYLKQTHKKGD
jgi:hypothetical protein